MLISKEKFMILLFAFCIFFTTHATANILPFNWTDLNPSSAPSAREFPCIAFNSCNGNIFLFGGSQNGSSFSDTWVFDTSSNTWTQLTPTSSPSARYGSSMVFDPSSGQIILFGGSYNGSNLDDTWSFDITANTWTELTPASPPSARYGSSMVVDASSGQIILFGGNGSSGLLNDTWAFDTRDNANTWTNLNPSVSPSARYSASAAFDPANGQIILFGGNGSSGLLNDTWTFNARDNANTWTNLNPSSSPSPLYGASMAFDPLNGQITLFGGSGNSGLVNQTWAFSANDDANTWTELTLSNPPSARYGAAMEFDPSSGQIILFGGSGNEGNLDDTWAYGIPSNAVLFWTNLNPSTFPPNRFSPCFVFDPSSGKMILFGGINNDDGTYFDDTWAYDATNNTWTELTPATSPSARDSARMAFDPTNGKIIMFGGHGVAGYLGDTWVYDSASNTWTNVTPATSPPARNGSTMTFDPCSGRMILFGGYGYIDADYDDTWAYDSKANTWTQLTPIGSPPARDSASITFDPTSGQIILFGGYSNNTGGNLLNDTWACVYNHASNTYTWTQLFPVNQPSGRYGSILKCNPASGQLILFGGGYLSSTSNDTWAYDGKANTWTELSPINPPESREFSGFDFNPINGQMILFSGVNLPSDTVVSGTEALEMGLPPQITSANEVSFEVGVFSSFTVTTSGFPNPAITETGTLPSGVTFVDNGDGTATLSGTPSPDTVEVYELPFTANNGLSAGVSQNFTLVILPVLPPRNFIGEIKKFSDNPKCILKAMWDVSLSQNIVHYLLYKNGILVDTVLANSQLVFVTCVDSLNAATLYQIVAVNSSNLTSPAVPISIVP
jgi:N-acetylneuraminic acid mutarotase